MRNISVVTCPSEIGASLRGSSLGPEALRISAAEHGYPFFELLPVIEVPTWDVQPYHAQYASVEYIRDFVPLFENIIYYYSQSLKHYEKTVALTGDHSNAAGFISAIKDTYPDKSVGVVWIDAHGDLHTPYTSPSGNLHGMPLGMLCGFDNEANKVVNPSETVKDGWDKLKKAGSRGISPKIDPRNLFFVDIRDLEEQEWNLIHEHSINHTTPDFRKDQGTDRIIEQIRNFTAQFDYLYVSFDVDSLDSSLVKGTGTPVEDGLSLSQAKKILRAMWNLPNCKTLEFTEVNPLLDNQNEVANHVIELLSSLETLGFSKIGNSPSKLD